MLFVSVQDLKFKVLVKGKKEYMMEMCSSRNSHLSPLIAKDKKVGILPPVYLYPSIIGSHLFTIFLGQVGILVF